MLNIEKREQIINLLEHNNIKLRDHKENYLINFMCEVVDFKHDSSISLIDNKNFRLTVEKGKVILATTFSNQIIDDVWWEEMDTMKFLKIKIQKIINVGE